MQRDNQSFMAYTDPTADIAPSAILGAGVKAWHLVQVREQAQIGDETILSRGVYVGPGVRIGRRCKIQNYACIYDPAELSDGVFVGPHVVFTNDKYPRAIGADGASKSVQEWDPVGVAVGTGASIGANATCVAPVQVGAWAVIAAGAVITKDVVAFALVIGDKNRQLGWVGHEGRQLVRAGSQHVWECPTSGRKYLERSDGLEEIDASN